jgi:hypothetical protein
MNVLYLSPRVLLTQLCPGKQSHHKPLSVIQLKAGAQRQRVTEQDIKLEFELAPS